jgi:CMP-N-acetylneuraminic acid synthetase
MRRKIVALIPAQGGSTRIPLKNITEFHGKPMLAWTIEASRNSGIFDRILVSPITHELPKSLRYSDWMSLS